MAYGEGLAGISGDVSAPKYGRARTAQYRVRLGEHGHLSAEYLVQPTGFGSSMIDYAKEWATRDDVEGAVARDARRV